MRQRAGGLAGWWWRRLLRAAKSREGALVGGVEGAGAATRCSLGTVATVATITAEAPPKVSTAATTTTSTALTVPTELAATTSAAASASSASTVARVGSGVVLTFEDQEILGLVLFLPLRLAAGRCHEVLVVRAALESSAFGELLLGALVGLASLEGVAAECETFLRLLGEVLVVGIGLLLGLGWRSILADCLAVCARAIGERWVGASRVRGEAGLVLGFRVGNGFTGLLVVPLAFAGSLAPASRGLLLVLASRQSVSQSTLRWLSM